jgi:hypothetical protein
MMNIEAEAREASWLRRRTIDDRADVLVVHRRARALLELAGHRFVRVSWGAWVRVQRSGTEVDGEPLAPTPRVAELVAIVEALADGCQVLPHHTGAPRHATDPRIAAIDELAHLAGVGLDDLDDRTHRIGLPIDRMLREAMERMRRAATGGGADGRRDRAHKVPAKRPPAPADLPVYSRSVAARAGLRLWVRVVVFDEPPHYDEPVLDEPPGFYEEPEPIEVSAANLVVRKALSGVARVDGRGDLDAVADLLVGFRTGLLRQYELDKVKTFGTLRDCQRWWVLHVLEVLAQEGLVSDGRLTEMGRSVMLGDEVVDVPLPDES